MSTSPSRRSIKIKRGKSEKYIKNEAEFTREIMRRATENLTLEAGMNGVGPKVHLEGGELRAFLMELDEFQQISHKLERRLRDPRVVEVLGGAESESRQQGGFCRCARTWRPLAEGVEERGR